MKIRFNLLPPKQKKHLKIQKTFRTVIEQEIHLIFIFLFLIVGLFSMYFVLKTKTNITQVIKDEISQQSAYSDVMEIQKNFKAVHRTISSVEKLEKERVQWSKLLIILSENISPKVMVQSLKNTGDKITMKAIANTREDAVSLKKTFEEITINDVKCFDKISIPESELAVPIDVSFTMTFVVDLNCLK